MHILKVANISNSRNTGMGRVMHSTADELRRMGHTVEFMFSEDVPRRHSARGDRLVFPYALVGAIKKRILQRGVYDVVEIHEPSAAWYCYFRRRDKTLPPCVVMSHGLEEAQWLLRQKLDQALGKRTSLKSKVLVPMTLLSQANFGLKNCQQVMCLNSYDEQYLQRAFGVHPEKISRIQNGTSPLFFDTQPILPMNKKSLLFVGSWLERKGNFILAEVFDKLHKKDPDIALTLMGTGYGEKEVLASFSPRSRPSVRVFAYADDTQLRDAYHSHAVFAFPSYFEPWGLVLMEAAAAGMALVTTCTGGPHDLFSNNENALLVEPLNVEQLGDALWKLITNDTLRKRLGENAKRHAAQFTWEAAATTQLYAYERALQASVLA